MDASGRGSTSAGAGGQRISWSPFISCLRFGGNRPQDAAPIRCFVFDGIGVRHPGIGHTAGQEYASLAISHYRATCKNRRHTPGATLDSLTTLRTDK